MISIHAPTRGATTSYCRFFPLWLFQSTLPQGERPSQYVPLPLVHLFQSTLPQGERQILLCLKISTPQFQSTLPQGERPGQSWLFVIPAYFNPRSHKGSDSISFDASQVDTISIHAPTRGATGLDAGDSFHGGISIHAPTRGATAISHKKIFLSSEIL